MSIGEQLRQAREAQAISLDQAALATHIRLHYLEALEAGQFDLLPSSAQVRGFIRAYGDYLKLNSAELLQSLDSDWKASQVTTRSSPGVEAVNAPSPNSDVIFKEIGQTLRSQRELMGLSLADVERHTHLRMHYVQALEEGDISHLPSPVQGRGMLSNYASFLGLNTETILLRFADGLQTGLYDRQVARNPSQSKPRKGEKNNTPTRPSQMRRLLSFDFFAGGFLIIFLIGFAVWGGLRISALRSDQEPSPTAPPVSEVLLTTLEEPFSATSTIMPTTGMSTETIVAGEISPGVETTQAPPIETSVVLEPTPGFGNAAVQLYIVANQQAWMRIIVDGEIAYEGRTLPGSAYTFSGNGQIILRTGNAGGLQVYFNQSDLGFLGAFGEVVERVFTAQGAQTATPAVQSTATPVPTDTPLPTGSPTPSNTTIPSTLPATPRVTPIP